MANDARRLIVLIDGDNDPYQAIVSTNDDLFFLKKVIWEGGKNSDFRDVDAEDLVLWKVSRFSRSYPVCS